MKPVLRFWSVNVPEFRCDGALFRLVSEAHRIRLAHPLTRLLAVHIQRFRAAASPDQRSTSHALNASALPVADDPGAGKTIMAGRSSRS